jgi:lipopolysaccharide biosynthesis glycosyltransferase
MNLKFLREDKFLEKLNILYEKYHHKLLWPDQCLLNIYSAKSRLILDGKYNAYIKSKNINKEEWINIEEKSKILHFIEKIKPWHEASRNHVSQYWWSYAKIAGQNDLKPVKCSNLTEFMHKCDSLEEYGNYEESSKIKSNIIKYLLNQTKQAANNKKSI